jgi:glycosyltransferase involved in cell wall biosynthesis
VISSTITVSDNCSIVFFGTVENFNFWQIGGMESYFRRLAFELAKTGKDVDFVQYGSDRSAVEHPFPGISLYRYVFLDDALAHIAQKASIVLVSSQYRKDRLKFIKFRRANQNRITFYFVASYCAKSRLRRKCYFLESFIYPYNGGVLCMSPRLLKVSGTMKIKSELLLPPVPESYFVEPEDKALNNKVTVTYMGRTAPSKGADEAVKIFAQLRGQSSIQTQLCGYSCKDTHESSFIHEWLMAQSDIKYIYEDHKGWSPSIDKKVVRTLRETDILLLPYRSLRTTIDVPLLLLEGMAANCCIITTPIGDIPEIYGESSFILPIKNFVPNAVALIKQAQQSAQMLKKERCRIASQVMNLAFDTQSISKKLFSKKAYTNSSSHYISSNIPT